MANFDTSTYWGVGGWSGAGYYGACSYYVTDNDTNVVLDGGTAIWYKDFHYFGLALETKIDGTTVRTWEGYASSSTTSFQQLGASYGTWTQKVYTKGHSSYTATITNRAYGKTVSGYGSAGGDVSGSITITIPALAKYTVSYNANGGSGAPSSQTKWHSETLTLSTTKPTRTGYTFQGWATSSTGSVAYAAGGSYTANAAVTLYAVWKLNTYTVSYNANGGSGTVNSQTKSYGVTLTLASSGFTRSYYTLDGWATSASGSVAYALGASYTGNAALSLYAHWRLNAPAAPTNASVTRNSDTSATVSWTNGTGYATTYSRIYIEQSVDGGSWSVVTYVSGTSTSYNATTSANHSYRFRVRAWNNGNGNQYSSYATTGYIYNTPAAPASVTGERTGTGTSVLLTVSNGNANTATGFGVQYSIDNSTWTNATVASSTGTPVTSITIDNMSGSVYFRVRNTRGSLASAWVSSGLVVVLTPPNAPTLTAPTSGQIIGATSASQSVTFSWTHNPIDGSSQAAYTLRYRRSDVSSWTTVTGTTAQSRSISLTRGYEYIWQVKTKGAATTGGTDDDGYGEWSGTQTFSVLQPPSVTVTEPSDTVIGMPITYELSYLDNAGVFASGTISILLSGTVLYSESLPATSTTVGTASPITGQITTDEFIPSSGNTYTIQVDVRSSDTLTGTTTASMVVSMGEPQHGTLELTNDAETGYVSLNVGWDTSTGVVDAQYATLYRVSSEGRVLVADNLSNGAGVLDKYAPLNTDYTYEVVTHAASTAIFTVTFSNYLKTNRWFVYWGSNVAWAIWNPSGNYSLTRPEKKRVHYAGRKWPLSYDSLAMEQAHSISWTVVSLENEDWQNNFIQLMNDGGRGVYKSCDGWVFHADFDYTETPNYTSVTHMGQVSLTITRIDGEAL